MVAVADQATRRKWSGVLSGWEFEWVKRHLKLRYEMVWIPLSFTIHRQRYTKRVFVAGGWAGGSPKIYWLDGGRLRLGSVDSKGMTGSIDLGTADFKLAHEFHWMIGNVRDFCDPTTRSVQWHTVTNLGELDYSHYSREFTNWSTATNWLLIHH